MRRRCTSPSKNEQREPVCSERDIRAAQQKRAGVIRSDIRVSERSEDGFPCRSEDDPALSRPTILKVQREPALSAAVSGRHNRNRVSIIRSDIRVPERSEDGCPCRSEDDPALSRPTILKVQREPALSAAVSGRHNRNRVSIIRSDIRVSERSEDGCPCRSEDNTDP